MAGFVVGRVAELAVPRDEFFLSIVEAALEELVLEAYARAGIPFERISAAISLGPIGRDQQPRDLRAGPVDSIERPSSLG